MYHVGYTPLCSNANSTVYLNTTNTNITVNGVNMSSPYLITVQAANALGLGQQVNVTAKGIISPGEHFYAPCRLSILSYNEQILLQLMLR